MPALRWTAEFADADGRRPDYLVFLSRQECPIWSHFDCWAGITTVGKPPGSNMPFCTGS